MTRNILVDKERFEIPINTIQIGILQKNVFDITSFINQNKPKVIADLIERIKNRTSKRQLTNIELEMVRLNQQSYKQPELRQNINLWEYLPLFSNIEVATFRNGNKILIVYKGTSNAANVVTDLNLLYKNVTDATFIKSLDLFDKVKLAFPNSEIIISGHSLGGTKALFVSRKRFVKGIVFNSFIPNRFNNLFDILINTPLMVKINNRDDILSNNAIILNPPGLVVMVLQFSKRTLIANHSIDTFLNVDDYVY